IARETADRVARKKRIGAEMEHLAVVPRRLEPGDPRYIAFEDEDRVGTIEVGARVIAEMAAMVGGERQMARPVLDDWERKAWNKMAERSDGRWIGPGARGDDQRVLGSGKEARGFVDSILVGAGRGSGDAACRHVVGKTGKRRR